MRVTAHFIKSLIKDITTLEDALRVHRSANIREDFVFDENKTVVWNREEVRRRNQSNQQYIDEIVYKIRECESKFYFSVIQYIRERSECCESAAVEFWRFVCDECETHDQFDEFAVDYLVKLLDMFDKLKCTSEE